MQEQPSLLRFNSNCLGREGSRRGLRPTQKTSELEAPDPEISTEGPEAQRIPRQKDLCPSHGCVFHGYLWKAVPYLSLLVHVKLPGPFIYGVEKQSTNPACSVQPSHPNKMAWTSSLRLWQWGIYAGAKAPGGS